jgi:transposase
MAENFTLFVGIDWGSETHHVCGVDLQGAVVFREAVSHRGEDVLAFVEKLLKRASAETIAVAIETPHNTIIEALIDRHVAAFAINPKQLDRFRDRHSMGGAKDDTLDAFVAADSLRTDMKLFRRIELGDPIFVELREMTRAHDSLVADTLQFANRLREQLRRYYPKFLELGGMHDEPWLWELLQEAPTPATARHLKPAKVTAILKRHRIRRSDASAVLTALRSTPLPVAPGVVEAASAHALLLLAQLRVSHTQRLACDARIESLMKQLSRPENGESDDPPKNKHRDAAILLSVAGLGVQTSATMLTEAATAIQQRDYSMLRVQTGIAPVRRQTGIQGKRKAVPITMRWACNARLRNAVHYWANTSVFCDERSRAHYAELRKRGHNHNRALRGVGDRLLKMLVSMLKSGTLYDANRRAAAPNLPAPTPN